jgi:hypothetical protein
MPRPQDSHLRHGGTWNPSRPIPVLRPARRWPLASSGAVTTTSRILGDATSNGLSLHGHERGNSAYPPHPLPLDPRRNRLAWYFFRFLKRPLERLAQDWDGWAAHDDTYVVDGENVVVLARYTATHKHSRNALNVRVAHHFAVRGGLIVRFEQFVDTALVRDAVEY